ncbi:MAG TPA: tetratricopeptide repeat protein [Geobacteraceae bacterium]
MMPVVFMVLALVLALMPGSAAAHPETGFLPDAIAEVEYKMVLEINPKDIKTRNRLGIVLYRKNRLKEAEEQFALVLRQSPSDFDGHDGMGLVKLKGKQFREAIAWFQRAIVLHDEDTLVHYNLGQSLEGGGRYDEARREYEKALAINQRLLGKEINRELESGKTGLIKSALQRLAGKPSRGQQSRT